MTIGERLLAGLACLRGARARADEARCWNALEPALRELGDALGRRHRASDEQREQALQHVRVQLWLGKCRATSPGEATSWVRTTFEHKLLSLSRAERARQRALDEHEREPTSAAEAPAPEERPLDEELAELIARSTQAREELLQAAELAFAGHRYARNKQEGVEGLLAYELDGRRQAPAPGLSPKALKTFQNQLAQRRKRARGFLAEIRAAVELSPDARRLADLLSAEAQPERRAEEASDDDRSGSGS